MQEVGDLQGSPSAHDLIAGRRPVVIRNYVSTWPSVQKALLSDTEIMDYLAQTASPDRAVTVYRLPAKHKGRFFYSPSVTEVNFSSSRESLPNILDVLKAQKGESDVDTFYVGSTTVDKYLPGFSSDNNIDLDFGCSPMVSIWLGNESKIAAHFDAPNNVACCVAGQRRFTLFPPNQIENLYAGPLHKTPSGQIISMVDMNNPDYSKYPKFKIAEESAYQALLNPGDAIFIPSMWWHQVESLGTFNVLVNYWWRNVPKYKGPGMEALMHGILNIRDLPVEEREAWRAIFDYYIFSDQAGLHDHIPENAKQFLGELDDIKARQLRASLINQLNR